MSKYTDAAGTSRSPALAYYNLNDQYKIDWGTDKTTIEFWVKPCKEQTDIGTIVQLDNSYAVTLIPDSTSAKNGVYSKYKIGIYKKFILCCGEFFYEINKKNISSEFNLTLI